MVKDHLERDRQTEREAGGGGEGGAEAERHPVVATSSSALSGTRNSSRSPP